MALWADHWTLELPGTPPMAAVARIFVRQFFAGHSRVDDAELVVSELFTNAVRYSRSKDEGNVIVRAVRQECSIRLEVTDQGSELVPQVKHAAADEDCGRGLFIVRALAGTWGHEGVTGEFATAWAVLDPFDGLLGDADGDRPQVPPDLGDRPDPCPPPWQEQREGSTTPDGTRAA
ncbi:hypothetical protein Acor_22190 [Acrocarpospora corrugata]|uniref:Histidine kinase/HSP90-like ATPase domain-containing protein n=1 Tax=Acrocarpospora corrugata TaxID=35763 RepID=A0A5M3VUA3_9ACTN|nr:ATP-binding protein [Acrocarpospora corrugata]GES00156.1 hypothetical protein Acor_22190 [Acrocarpospora corrugata]